jgi:hypothetical protein
MLERTGITGVEARQIALLWVLLADKKLLARVRPSDMTHPDMQAALDNVQRGGEYDSLRRVLKEWVGLDWDGKEKLSETLIRAVKHDGSVSLVVQLANEIAQEHLERNDPEFVSKMLNLEELLDFRRKAIEHPEATYQEGLKKERERNQKAVAEAKAILHPQKGRERA